MGDINPNGPVSSNGHPKHSALLPTSRDKPSYRGYFIYYDPPPIGTRCCDWHFVHEDYDLDDPRHGSAASEAGCRAEIDMIEDDR
jgi:hypothetical protein